MKVRWNEFDCSLIIFKIKFNVIMKNDCIKTLSKMPFLYLCRVNVVEEPCISDTYFFLINPWSDVKIMYYLTNGNDDFSRNISSKYIYLNVSCPELPFGQKEVLRCCFFIVYTCMFIFTESVYYIRYAWSTRQKHFFAGIIVKFTIFLIPSFFRLI